LKRRADGTRNNSWLLLIAVVQILFSAAHATSLFIGVLQAFRYSVQGVSGPLSFLSNMGETWHLAEEAFFMSNESIASVILVWRCYRIWDRNLWLAFPLMLICIATPVPGVWCTLKMARLPPDIGLEDFFDEVNPCLVPFGMLTIITKISATLLISWRVWRRTPRGNKWLMNTEWFVVRIITEAGALYSVLTIVGVILVLSDSPGGHVVAGMLGQISATAPFLIIIRSEMWREKVQEDSGVILSDGPFDVPSTQLSGIGDLVHRRTARDQSDVVPEARRQSVDSAA